MQGACKMEGPGNVSIVGTNVLTSGMRYLVGGPYDQCSLRVAPWNVRELSRGLPGEQETVE